MPQRKLYLYGGQTYVLVPESTWLSEMKQHPRGITALKAVEEPFLLKGWTKLRQVVDLNSHAVTTEWLFEETDTHLKVSVCPEGVLTVGNTCLGNTYLAEVHKQLEAASKDAADPKKAGKWITITKEIMDKDGNKVRIRRPVFIPADKVRKDDAEADSARVEPVKGSALPIPDVMAQRKSVLSQAMGQYTIPVLETEVKKDEPKTVEDIILMCNRILELAEKEEDPLARERMCDKVDGLLQLAESQVAKASFGTADWPDSAFMWVPPEAKGPKGKKSLRKLPYKNKDGSISLSHVRNALARLNQTQIPSSAKASIKSRLQAILRRESPGYKPPKG